MMKIAVQTVQKSCGFGGDIDQWCLSHGGGFDAYG
jgi:hypothetical protein